MRYVAIEGGLGNQMFQYAFILALRSRGYEVCSILTSKKWEHENGYELERVFGIKDGTVWNTLYKNFLFRILFRLTHKRFSGKNFIFQPEALSSDCKFYYGTWQSGKYFQDICEKVLNVFTFNNDLLSAYTLSVLSRIEESRVSVSLHVRRGDYLSDPKYKGICDLGYYTKAIYIAKSITGNNSHFVVFSNDMAWCEEHIKPLIGNSTATFVDWNTGTESYKDMRIMSACRINIVANSSFSWWAAYMNMRSDKHVIAPNTWINLPLSYRIQCDEWECI